MPEDELPAEVRRKLEASLPADLDEWLTDVQKSTLSGDLAGRARLRREAELLAGDRQLG
jgi:hypothetical protein